MRITHRYGRDPDGFAVDVEWPQCVVGLGFTLQSMDVERYACRLQNRRAHIDGDAPIGFECRLDYARHGFDLDCALVGQAFVGNEFDEGAGAVAALLDLAAIGVINTVAKIDIGRRRLLDHQHLVGAHAEAPVGQELPLRRREFDLLIDRVDHDKVIARAVHFGEFEFHDFIINYDCRGTVSGPF